MMTAFDIRTAERPKEMVCPHCGQIYVPADDPEDGYEALGFNRCFAGRIISDSGDCCRVCALAEADDETRLDYIDDRDASADVVRTILRAPLASGPAAEELFQELRDEGSTLLADWVAEYVEDNDGDFIAWRMER